LAWEDVGVQFHRGLIEVGQTKAKLTTVRLRFGHGALGKPNFEIPVAASSSAPPQTLKFGGMPPIGKLKP
jgi:hypothetical protein